MNIGTVKRSDIPVLVYKLPVSVCTSLHPVVVAGDKIRCCLFALYYIDLAVEYLLFLGVVAGIVRGQTLRVHVVAQENNCGSFIDRKRLLQKFQYGMNTIFLFTCVTYQDDPAA